MPGKNLAKLVPSATTRFMAIEPLLLGEMTFCFETYSKPSCTNLMLRDDLEKAELPIRSTASEVPTFLQRIGGIGR